MNLRIVFYYLQVAVKGQYKFSNCGAATDPIQLKNLVITPHPMKAPGFADFALTVDFSENLVNPIQVCLFPCWTSIHLKFYPL